MTGDFRWTVPTIAHLPAAACITSAPGGKSPLGRGGGAAQRAFIGVLSALSCSGGATICAARTDRLAPQTTREPMRRMSLCVVVSSPPDDLRCYRQIGGKGRF